MVVVEGGGCFLCARYPCTRATGAGVAQRVGVGTPGGVGFILSDFGFDGFWFEFWIWVWGVWCGN